MIRGRIAVLLACLMPHHAAALDGQALQARIVQALADAGQGGAPVVSASRPYPPCANPLDVAPHQGGWQAVQVSCAGTGGWSRVIRIEGGTAAPRLPGVPEDQPQGPALVLTESLSRGTVLEVGHLREAPINGRARGDLVVSLDTAIGRRLKSNLGAGQALLARHLDHDWQVTDGGPVTIVTVLGGIRIEAAGVALEPGQLGQDIRVTNAGSGEVVHVTVTDRNKVTVRPNIR